MVAYFVGWPLVRVHHIWDKGGGGLGVCVLVSFNLESFFTFKISPCSLAPFLEKTEENSLARPHFTNNTMQPRDQALLVNLRWHAIALLLCVSKTKTPKTLKRTGGILKELRYLPKSAYVTCQKGSVL